jgi:hypothetical protein
MPPRFCLPPHQQCQHALQDPSRLQEFSQAAAYVRQPRLAKGCVKVEGIIPLAELAKHVGEEVGVSSWITLDQGRIQEFAHCTGDHQ